MVKITSLVTEVFDNSWCLLTAHRFKFLSDVFARCQVYRPYVQRYVIKVCEAAAKGNEIGES